MLVNTQHLFIYYFAFWVTPGGPLDLLLDLFSENISGGLRESRSAMFKASVQLTILSLKFLTSNTLIVTSELKD